MNGILGMSNLYFFMSLVNFRLLICQNSYFLGSLPNSHQNIEPELMRSMMFDTQILAKSSSTKGIELLETWPNVGSLSSTDEFSSDELYRFLLNSKDVQNSVITGSEAFSGEMLKSSSEDILMIPEILD